MTLTVVEKLKAISEAIGDLITFVQEDKEIQPDFEEYLKTIGATEATQAQMQSVCLPYIFERNIESKSIIEIFLEKKQKKRQNTKSYYKRTYEFNFIDF